MNLSKILDAICNNDILFLRENVDNYNISSRIDESDGDTLLQYAISDNGSNVYKELIELGADTGCVNDIGENLLHSAVYSGAVDRIKFVIWELDKQANINDVNAESTTPLLLSLFLEKEDIALELIKAGADVNISDNDGNSPLHIACYYGYINIVIEIIKRGGEYLRKDNSGNYPLAIAVNQDKIEVVKYLYNVAYKDE